MISYLRRIPLLVTSTVNGSLSGLVAIAAGCAVLEPMMAALTGFIAGIIFSFGRDLMLKMQIDDVVDAVTVHGTCGLWGTIAAGLFFAGDMFNLERIFAQCFGVVVAFCWTFLSALLVFAIIRAVFGLRSKGIHEQRGLDISEHNEIGYPEFQKSTFRAN